MRSSQQNLTNPPSIYNENHVHLFGIYIKDARKIQMKKVCLCKVGEGRVAKVADFGLTRDVYIDEAYWKRSSGKCKLLFLPHSPISCSLHLIKTPPAHPIPSKKKRGQFKFTFLPSCFFSPAASSLPLCTVPIKWMAPESMKDYLYTSKSDVWGFGVSLFTCCHNQSFSNFSIPIQSFSSSAIFEQC